MQYKEFLKKEKKCPFCSCEYGQIIKENKKAFLTYALAPYFSHHLLVIPKRHVLRFEELTKIERENIDKLLYISIIDLKSLGYDDYSILLRNGEKTGKTVEHLHYHIIPSIEIGSLKSGHIKRKIMTNKEISKLMKDFKNIKRKK